jgi:hypothetical protein
MASLNHWHESVVDALRRHERRPDALADFSVDLIVNEEHDRFLLLCQGWNGFQRIHGVLVHIDLIDGKIWVQKDDTKEGVATDLTALGVPPDAIVLGFKHPTLRPFTEFAAA